MKRFKFILPATALLFFAVSCKSSVDVGSVDKEVFIHKTPKSWLINEESKAKDTRFWIEEF